tara:strand:+ start:81 stop:815 length:735 start_codon:yes stop_codon:yes gene_type:complete
MKTLILIPSRLAATRLPGKPLLKINGLSIISHVMKRAIETNLGEVYVASGDKQIIADIEYNGGNAILTSKDHKTGTDRIYEAFKALKKPDIELIINLQGDEPLINIEDVRNLHKQMIKTKSRLGTLASKIVDKNLYNKESVVKVETRENLENDNFSEALDFSRKFKETKNHIYHHLGIYCYQVKTLENFVNLEQSKNEIGNNLEQLRALDNNIKINVALAKSSSVGVDTEEDFVSIKKIMEYKT